MASTPRLLVVGHVTWDRVGDSDQLGGSVSYAAACALRLGWEAAILTAAGPDFEPWRDLPDVRVFRQPSADTSVGTARNSACATSWPCHRIVRVSIGRQWRRRAVARAYHSASNRK